MPQINRYIDLHIHSKFSDGAYSPDEIVRMASENSVDIIAIADHDTIDGIDQAIEAGTTHSVKIVPAVELSVELLNYSDVHLLALGIDHKNLHLNKNLAIFKTEREKRNVKILEKINQRLSEATKTEVSEAEVLLYADGVIGRPHIARALLARGYVKNIEDAFQKFLIPCNVPKKYWQTEDAIRAVHAAGGIAVLAHPTTITNDIAHLEIIIDMLIEHGLDGIEVYNNMAYPQEQECLRRYAEKRRLVATAGSDFHGIEQGIAIGKGKYGAQFEYSLFPPIAEAIAKSATAINYDLCTLCS